MTTCKCQIIPQFSLQIYTKFLTFICKIKMCFLINLGNQLVYLLPGTSDNFIHQQHQPTAVASNKLVYAVGGIIHIQHKISNTVDSRKSCDHKIFKSVKVGKKLVQKFQKTIVGFQFCPFFCPLISQYLRLYVKFILLTIARFYCTVC